MTKKDDEHANALRLDVLTQSNTRQDLVMADGQPAAADRPEEHRPHVPLDEDAAAGTSVSPVQGAVPPRPELQLATGDPNDADHASAPADPRVSAGTAAEASPMPPLRSSSDTPSSLQSPALAHMEPQGPYAADTPSPDTTQASVPPAHAVPPGFRGPIPREGDAEDVAPAPLWVPVPGVPDASLGNTPNVPMNKNGWRYTAAGPAAHVLPQTVFRTLEIAPPCAHWSWQDRSAYTRISSDASIVGADKGFRSARTNIGVRHDAWYVEIEILPPDASSAPAAPMRDGPHARVGWGRREAALNAPVGLDAYSYGMRDQTGGRVTLSRPQPFAERAFGVNDIVGLYIRLPPRSAPVPPGSEPTVRRKQVPIRYKGQLYFESLEYPPTKDMEAIMDQSRRGAPSGSAEHGEHEHALDAGVPNGTAAGTRRGAPTTTKAPTAPPPPPPTLDDSCIGFVVNGEPQGIAFTDLYDYRPRRAQAAPRREKKKHAANDETVITAHSDVSTVLKSRANPFDDGALGYFPMVSLYGGARARIIPDHFRYPPPADLEDALWRAPGSRHVRATRTAPAPPWRAFGARFAEACAENDTFDMEGKQAARAPRPA